MFKFIKIPDIRTSETNGCPYIEYWDVNRLMEVSTRLQLYKPNSTASGLHHISCKTCVQSYCIYLTIKYSQTCLSDPLYITTSFVNRPYLFLPNVFPCIRPLYNDPLSNATYDRVLWVKIFHITTIGGLLSNWKLDNR